ncbi:hypothetical protein Glove_16g167 [Diversispora epigaea]|uniref:DNA polymerase delta subunit 4 n=1 Tax=Diversispora epigaea TaxID=1348612 RepID=A0A397JNS6_9GLOM|nr:hypothetical protein Glove_16g167 [Diversispora epigaea]
MSRDSSTKRPRKIVQQKLTDILNTSKRDDSQPFKKVKTRIDKSVDSSAIDSVIIDSSNNNDNNNNNNNEAESSTSVSQERKLNYEKKHNKQIKKQRNQVDQLFSNESDEEENNKVDEEEIGDEFDSELELEKLEIDEYEDDLEIQEKPKEEVIESVEQGARSILTFHEEDLTPIGKMLRSFDLDYKYGPCVGVKRLDRWERAYRLGMDPPLDVKVAIINSNDLLINENIFHNRL